LLVGVLIGLATVLLFLPAVGNDFLSWDDYRHIHQNPHLRIESAEDVAGLFTSFLEGSWWPLTLLSWSMDHALWGLDPRGYHLTNVLIHGLNAFLATLLMGLLIGGRLGQRGGVGWLCGAAVAGVLFGVHPVHVEPVAWVTDRTDLLYAFFWLMSVLVYLRYVSATGRRRVAFYVLAVALFACSLMSKAMAVSLPITLLILDAYPLGRLRRPSDVLRVAVAEKVPFYLGAAAMSAVAIVARGEAGALASEGLFPLWQRLLVAAKAVPFYLGKIAMPLGLSPYYPLPRELSWWSPLNIASLSFVACVTLLCVVRLRHMPWLAAAWAYFIVTLLPALGIMQVGSQAAADRYLYLALLGPVSLAGAGAARLWSVRPRWRLSLGAVTLAAVLVFSGLSVRQMGFWKNTYSLWDRVLHVYPESSWAYGGRGMAQLEAGNAWGALEDFNRAVAIEERYGPDSDHPSWLYWKSHWMYHGRGVAYLELGRHEAAIQSLTRAIELMPHPPQAVYYKRRAEAYQATGRYEQAAADYRSALAVDPSYLAAQNNLGSTYVTMGDYARALDAFTRAVSLAPGNAQVIFNRGRVHLLAGRRTEAISDFRAAARLGFAPAQRKLRELDSGS
jgi:tetratricopeptide (TPR) repeat protein